MEGVNDTINLPITNIIMDRESTDDDDYDDDINNSRFVNGDNPLYNKQMRND